MLLSRKIKIVRNVREKKQEKSLSVSCTKVKYTKIK